MSRKPFFLLRAAGALLGCGLFGQTQFQFSGITVTGQLRLTATVNALQVAQAAAGGASPRSAASASPFKISPERSQAGTELGSDNSDPVEAAADFAALAAAPPVQPLLVIPTSTSFGFNGLTHLDQRQSNGGNQLSVEPASPSIAVANGFILQGVNNAIQVYNMSGKPLLPAVLSSNQLFAVTPAINRATGVRGVYPTDMRVFHDQTINRWFVVQRSLDNNAAGQTLNSSHLYMAVSQTGDPTGIYSIYTMDTTNAGQFRCPCLADYPQIGADQYGIYIAANEYDTFYNNFIDATILAISKTSLAAGVPTPTAYKFTLPLRTGFEFAIQPATTPPGSSYFLASGGVEYFVSSQSTFLPNTNLSIWAASNTSSLGTATPNLVLTQTIVPALPYGSPDVAAQRPGPLPYGSSLSPRGRLPVLDGGDTRILSTSYAGGRLYATLGTRVADDKGVPLNGGAYVILSPTLRGGVLAAPVLRQGYLVVKNNNVLRPAIGVNAKGQGAIAFTLVGPDYYPSSAFVPIDVASTGSNAQIVAMGAFPEDGFTAYEGEGIARWGDYSTAFAAADGTIWMTTEYIPNLPRTLAANWGTFVFSYIP